MPFGCKLPLTFWQNDACIVPLSDVTSILYHLLGNQLHMMSSIDIPMTYTFQVLKYYRHSHSLRRELPNPMCTVFPTVTRYFAFLQYTKRARRDNPVGTNLPCGIYQRTDLIPPINVKRSLQLLQQIYGANVKTIQYTGVHDLLYESPPMTTRPGLPPKVIKNFK